MIASDEEKLMRHTQRCRTMDAVQLVLEAGELFAQDVDVLVVDTALRFIQQGEKRLE